MPAVPPEVLKFYESGRELGRLNDHELAGPLELVRTLELFERFIPSTRCRVLDVGGGPASTHTGSPNAGTTCAWLILFAGTSRRPVRQASRRTSVTQDNSRKRINPLT